MTNFLVQNINKKYIFSKQTTTFMKIYIKKSDIENMAKKRNKLAGII